MENNQPWALTPIQIHERIPALSVQTIRGLIKANRLKHVKLQRRYLVSVIELNRFLTESASQNGEN
ncbi:MAG: helix-turn-helix domain-containing protein [Dehalococcoidales bacterium]